MQTQTLNFRFEVKALGAREFEGYGSTFGNVDLGDDVMMPGAFSETLAQHKDAGTLPQMFWMHDMSEVPGKWTTMSEDASGLYVKGILANTQLGNEMHTLLNMKAVRGLSIGFSIADRSKDVSYNEDGVRLIHKVDLWEVSLVSLAMNPQAQITASKSRLSKDGEYVPAAHELKRDFERGLREVGYSKNGARFLVSQHVKFDDDPGVMLDGQRRDAVPVDDEAEEILKSLEAFNASVLRAALQR